MLKQKYFLTGIFILSAERQPIKLAWRKIVWLQYYGGSRITQKRVDEINKLLHNAWINYRYDNGSDEDYLDGNLSDYITQ